MEHSFQIGPAAPALVFGQLVDTDFLTAFSDELGVTVDGIHSQTTADTHQATMLWEFATAGLPIPGGAARFLGSQVALRWEQSWSAQAGSQPSHTGTLQVVLSGRPGATTKGSTWLKPFGSATLLGTDATTSVSLPRPLAKPLEATVDSQLVGWILGVQARVLKRRLGLPD